jgi:cytochrome c
MKFTYLLLGVAMITLSSFTNDNSEDKYTKKTNTVEQQSEGEKLISKMDCVGCHKLDKKLIGPSYLDIAKKYDLNDKNINYLSAKIIKGGSGVWGSIPMAAHSTLKKDDAKKIAKYILSLKK